MNTLLARPPLLDHLFVAGASPEFIGELAQFQKEITFEKGEVLLREKEFATHFYLILEGDVQIEAQASKRNAVTIQTVGPGDLLGWSWLYAPYVWHFTATALTPGRALVFNAAPLLVRAEENPRFGYEMMKRITRHVVSRLEKAGELLATKTEGEEVGLGESGGRTRSPDRAWLSCHGNKE
jgi:CRP/FNR family cyclic AMP-dependent transcriptional regulator